MLVSYQEIELRVKFADQAQLAKWKTGIMKAMGKYTGSNDNSLNNSLKSKQFGLNQLLQMERSDAGN